MYDLYPAWAREMFTLESVSLNGESVPYLQGGDGVPVVMLHGLSGSLDWWQYNAPDVSRHFQVYLPDLPGYGRLGHLRTCDSMLEYVDWVRRWIEAAGIECPHLVGHSMGGHIALRLAADDPDALRRLILVAPAGVLPATRLPHYFIPLLRVLADIPVALLPLAIRDLQRADLRTVWHSSRDLIERHVLDLLPRVLSETLIIWGDNDPIIPLETARSFTDLMPNAQLDVVPNAGHLPMVDAPEQCNRRIIDFLEADQDSDS